MRVIRSSISLLLVLSLLAACGDSNVAEEQQPAAGADADDRSGMAMPEMEGMNGMQGGMMGPMMSHMEMMRGMSGDSMKAMLPVHRQMMANNIARMNREMREMNMAADATWDAVVDSLRQDLVRMPEMTATELAAFMTDHRRRMMRLMEAHGAMMGRAKR